jgi:hypothetical protein
MVRDGPRHEGHASVFKLKIGMANKERDVLWAMDGPRCAMARQRPVIACVRVAARLSANSAASPGPTCASSQPVSGQMVHSGARRTGIFYSEICCAGNVISEVLATSKSKRGKPECQERQTGRFGHVLAHDLAIRSANSTRPNSGTLVKAAVVPGTAGKGNFVLDQGDLCRGRQESPATNG